jgi:hypothetical protein
MPDGRTDQPRLTVGSLLGFPLGTAPSYVPVVPSAAPQQVGQVSQVSQVSQAPQPAQAPSQGALSTEEQPWTVVAGTLSRHPRQEIYRPDGVEALTYDNAFQQPIEQVWFDDKVVYALDLGEVDVTPERVKVAQEYQIVYGVHLDEQGHLQSEPERVPGQLNIYDSVPGMDKYSPIWQFNYVVVPRDYSANSLRSEAECLASGYPVHRSQVFEN